MGLFDSAARLSARFSLSVFCGCFFAIFFCLSAPFIRILSFEYHQKCSQAGRYHELMFSPLGKALGFAISPRGRRAIGWLFHRRNWRDDLSRRRFSP